MEEKAARAYDLAALKYWGPSTHINFPVRFPWRAVFKFKSGLLASSYLILSNKTCRLFVTA